MQVGSEKMTNMIVGARDAQAYLDDPRHVDGSKVGPRLIMDQHFAKARLDAVAVARDCFLNFIADARRFDEDIDGDETGMSITYFIESEGGSFAELAEALGINPRWMESAGDAVRRTIDEECAASTPKDPHPCK